MALDARETVAIWRRAGECGNVDAAGSALAADVVLISPLTAKFRFRGREQVLPVIAAAFEVISVIRYHTEVFENDTCALFYRSRASGQQVEEAQLLRFDRDGLIREITLYGRPLPGVTGVMAAIGPALLRRQGRRRLAFGVRIAVAPLHAVVTASEKYMVPLADPSRPRKP